MFINNKMIGKVIIDIVTNDEGERWVDKLNDRIIHDIDETNITSVFKMCEKYKFLEGPEFRKWSRIKVVFEEISEEELINLPRFPTIFSLKIPDLFIGVPFKQQPNLEKIRYSIFISDCYCHPPHFLFEDDNKHHHLRIHKNLRIVSCGRRDYVEEDLKTILSWKNYQ